MTQTPTDPEALAFVQSLQSLRTRAEHAEQHAAEHETRSRIAEERLADSERRLRVAEMQRDAYMRFCAEILVHHNNLQTALSAAGEAASRAARYTERQDPKLESLSATEQRQVETLAQKFAPTTDEQC